MDNSKLIAFYLPQYHLIPENDEWWGKGFTEWRNVAKAKPLFPGHYQPHLPADLGFYDLRLPESRQAQADLARQYGIHGFCYYHYWFNGRRILERPFQEVLESGKPDFPFCLCWANENWTRAWDGGDHHILLEQHYSIKDDLEHIRALIPALSDPRYIRIQGKPLLLIYRTDLLPEPARTADLWREVALNEGVGEIILARVEAFTQGRIDPRTIGFDAAVEFAPDWRVIPKPFLYRREFYRWLAKGRFIPDVHFAHRVAQYEWLVHRMLSKPNVEYPRFRCVCPGFDNSPRRSRNALILSDTDPQIYQIWLNALIRDAQKSVVGQDSVVFINAWNEWAEGNHLEPDERFGCAFLEATREALSETTDVQSLDAFRADFTEKLDDEPTFDRLVRRVGVANRELRYLWRLRDFQRCI
jgi:lipopolysaccharide biosynthesis protein